jgi:glycosyltransferase involved in cell wall biosynthesis
MKIAFISYEYPPDTADGGIATYVEQAARILSVRGHEVTVFAGTREGRSYEFRDNFCVRVIRQPVLDRSSFADAILPVFASIHQRNQFDVVEGPDYLADAHRVKEEFPTLPLVVKLHTCSQLVRRFSGNSVTPWAWLRGWCGAIRHRCKPWWTETLIEELERNHGNQAEIIAAPSFAVGDWTRRLWQIDTDPVVFPHPFDPNPQLLAISARTETKLVTFLGRVEPLKGVLELATAIPKIVRVHPKAQFRFVGSVSEEMKFELSRLSGQYAHKIEFTGKVPLESIPTFLAETDVAVFPSRWESFGFACLEAMAAARGVVASAAGGMSEIIENGKTGILIQPRDPRAIAQAVCFFLTNPELRIQMGMEARKTVLERYASTVTAPQQEAAYLLAIQRSSARRTF